jgi:hypothetical protein
LNLVGFSRTRNPIAKNRDPIKATMNGIIN